MTTTAISIEQLAELLGGKMWTKGDLKRIYLDRGYATKKMSTKTYVWQTELGDFKVSCIIDCPSQHDNWIEKEQDQIKDSVYEQIEGSLSEELEQATSQPEKIVSNIEVKKPGLKLDTLATEFKIGGKYLHNRFGTGIILSETDKNIEIEFSPEYGIKKLIKSFVKLEKAND